MKTLKHFNLPRNYGKKETYEIFQENYNRDTKRCFWWEVIFGITFLGGMFITGNYEYAFVFLGMIAIERKLTYFIDNSNRQHLMHLIDWMESKEVIIEKENKSELHNDDE